ncbi:MAG: ABC transporter substrate-binding protein [Marivibrio sp.]|uniref:heme/hemin ABC transporter substrate-binding protein n=1 Tax=Marivibrio sp. TaxID=2039719 RepID=UPI0032F01A8D
MTSLSRPTRRTAVLSAFAALAAGPLLSTRVQADARRRLIALGGAITETLYFLDRGDWLVGADTTSSYPSAAQDLPKVGYLRAVSAEGTLSLAPDLVIAEESAGPPDALEAIARAGAEVAYVPEARSIDGVVAKIDRIAGLVAAEEAAARLSATIRERAAHLADAVAGVERRPRVLFLMDLREGALLSAGEGTAAKAIIELAGGRNALDGFEGYKPVSAESILARAPDAILMMSHAAERHGGVGALARDPRLAGLQAVQDGRLIAMEGLKLLGFGPRTPDAARELAAALHGPAIAPPLGAPLEAS